mmetsp:Transcript_16193/g.44862  ORF Transcript_16193/g.44862 Transcript_16193/m.44862 type:complete len:264 (-) Transcript_16193:665-1456(-)
MTRTMMKCLAVSLLLACFGTTRAQGQDDIIGAPLGTWEGCGTGGITIGKSTTVCLVISNGPNWQEGQRKYMRLNFNPTADEYTRFHVPQSFQHLAVDTNNALTDTFSGRNVTVHVASQRAISMQRIYYDNGNEIFPHLTAVIDVKDGVARGIAWDDACVFCTKKECKENTYDFSGNRGTSSDLRQPTKGCLIEKSECVTFDAAGRTDCDLILYVVWTGTDSKGEAFQSSAYRFSAFPAQELSDRFSQNLPDIPTLPGTGGDDN